MAWIADAPVSLTAGAIGTVKLVESRAGDKVETQRE